MAASAFYIVPSDPLYLPPEEKRLAALAFFEEVSPLPNENGGYYFYVHDDVQFFGAGEGLEAAICPLCKARLELFEDGGRGDYWEGWVKDFEEAIDLWGDGHEVKLEHAQLSMPCCNNMISLLSLEFDMPSYFAKFAIGALEPSRSRHWEGRLGDYYTGSGSLNTAALDRFAEILGCSVKQLWEIC